MRERFPGIHDDWARFDGPAGTQMVDTAIDAITANLRSGDQANTHGEFAASEATTALVEHTRARVATLLGGDPDGIVFGANMTTLNFALTRALARAWSAGDEIVGTRLDHDANVTPWKIAAADAGAILRLAEFDPATGRLDPEAVTSLLGPRTRWVAVTGTSNALGTMPELAPIVDAAHAHGARVLVDAVHLVPHAPVDVGRIGCDILLTSPYKWYGPHAGVMWVHPELRETIPIAKVRPAPDTAPARFETGTPAFEALAGIGAAAEFLLEVGVATVAARERARFEPLLTGLLGLAHVQVLGPRDLDARTPTASFVVDGCSPDAVARHLATHHIAAWSGNYYAVETMAALGRPDGAVRVGVSAYTDADDVARLLAAISTLAV